MNLGVQYYRPPFPNERYWEDDFRRIADGGLNTVQLWVVWGWVEPEPGAFRFEDYDRLVELAGENGLGVVLSTIAEVQPHWILREVPGCDLVDDRGRPVPSVNRGECHFGITPGGCTDHPGVWERMKTFLETVVRRYHGAANVRGWDAWNELRWNVEADARVCYCEHTLAAFRRWLDERHGGLEGLNRAWIRRYADWADVQPGRHTHSPYTESMAFCHFLTDRASRHGRDRYDVMKPLDPDRPVTVHGPAPTILIGGSRDNQALNRGNDWQFADYTDGVGTSSFPFWFNMDDADFGLRVEAVRSAAQGKRVWLSEVQGGRAGNGFDVHRPVPPTNQQRWIWNGIACGADTILFWCWRDEVFGRESAGFGLAGEDGLAEARLEAMRHTGEVLRGHADLVAGYRPAEPEVGLWFSPQAYYLAWTQEGAARRPQDALVGYARALTRRSVPYTFVEEAHLGALDALKVLFMPRGIVTDRATEERLEAWVRAGGTLVAESECGAFDSAGLYRYGPDRFTSRLAGLREVGRRTLESETVEVTLGGERFVLPANQWLTPWQHGAPEVLAAGHPDGDLVVEVPVGEGRLILAGTYFGDAYRQRWSPDFERFVEAIARRAGARIPVEVRSPEPSEESFTYTKAGRSGERGVLFVFFPAGGAAVELALEPGLFASSSVTDIVTGAEAALEPHDGRAVLRAKASEHGFAVYVGE